MSIHKLTAGSGYDYLTRQVAALDATHKGHVGLAAYYTAKGEVPGRWVGSGMAGIDGLDVGDTVTAEQMKALYGLGLHPLAAERLAAVGDADVATVGAAGRLGTPFKVYANDVSSFQVAVAQHFTQYNKTAGMAADAAIPDDVRALIRTEVAAEFFTAEHGRPPADAREISGTIAKLSRPRTDAVAGYDLTFSPVKSVSTLWAVADQRTSAIVESAHHAAVADALRFIEDRALYTRTGAQGVRQVDVRGLVGAAFVHRDSRAGDPDLHTHVAVANKVQTLDGRWLSIDGRLLFKATVAAAEAYNTALEAHLTHRLGVRFAERPNPDPRKRPIREIVGVDPRLNQRWSSRRMAIEDRTGQLATQFQADHGRPPTPVETVQLAQQATLETRDAKHEPRSLAEQRATWRQQASEVLGGDQAIAAMVTGTVHRMREPVRECNQEWVRAAAGRVLEAMETRRSTWQVWHVHAESLRQIRPLALAPDQVEQVANRVTAEVLGHGSTSLARPDDGVVEPGVLRRRDGTSVYTVAGSDLYTSSAVLAAERRIVDLAGRTDGRTIPDTSVDVALLEMTANGVDLDPGQAALVRAMATSGRRLQLAIAPAGTGKTTAMHALTHAWTSTGGQVVGLAPSAAAATQLRDQTAAPTDTLAKHLWSITHNDLPDWAQNIGPNSLVIIDEAGMADTITLDTAIRWIVGRGGSVRLVGDDQQLAAIGAGGALRDIATTHGAVRLTELHRFTNPAEAAATLSLREGRPEALGFYLDQRRIHVGDPTTSADQLYAAWKADRNAGLDALMLAPTRELAAQLNQRARAEHVGRRSAETAVELADGNQASPGDVIITRRNDRRLRTSPTDWVKNGDRWTVQQVHRDGGLTVQHLHHGRLVRLPAAYVTEQVELGYATTVHAAQGVTADTMHGYVTGDEARQQLYTMATRGRTANHLYLNVVGDGDPHSVIRPEHVRPNTAVDILEQILARDDAARSATTEHRHLHDPAVRLGDAATRYHDALHTAAADIASPEVVERIDQAAEQISAGLTGEPAWPTLRGHLLFLHCDGHDPIQALQAAAAAREINSADDRAAVLDHRLPTRRGPLPWLPAVPQLLDDHEQWGPYLRGRADLIHNLTAQVQAATPDVPDWLPPGSRPDRQLVEHVAVWRAATGVDPTDRRPTGPAQLARTSAAYQRTLDAALADNHLPAVQEWGPAIRGFGPSAAHDPFLPVLAGRLAAINRAGINTRHLLDTAYAAGPLPDEHGAAAIWWRIQPHLQPAVAAGLDQPIATGWTEQLDRILGPERADSWLHSPAWPALIAVVQENLHRGNTLDQLLADTATYPVDGGDECQQWVWRLSLLLDPIPEHPEDREPVHDPAPADLHIGVPVRPHETHAAPQPAATLTEFHRITPEVGLDPRVDDDQYVDADLAVLAMIRRGPVAPSDQDVRRMLDRRDAWHTNPVTRDRLLEVNRQAMEFYRAQYTPQCWSRAYLTGRLGVDIADDPRFQPGHAPHSWTAITHHLRQLGVTHEEMELAGLVSRTRDGRIVDRFRNRLMLPIVHNTEILGFVARRHPDHGDNHPYAGPKYLNTPDTLLYSKGAQLYGPAGNAAPTAVPVLVEGPLDAIAITLATSGRHIGYAPLGTSLTSEQAAQLASMGHSAPIVATDHDIPGQIAAERAYWMLTLHGLDSRHATWAPGSDPADTLHTGGAAAIQTALHSAQPLADTLVDERLRDLPADQAAAAAVDVLAARPGPTWTNPLATINARTGADPERLHGQLRNRIRDWINDPRHTAERQLAQLQRTKARLTSAANADPVIGWQDLANRTDPRLTRQSDWLALANVMQAAHCQGLDLDATVADLTRDQPLNHRPAQDLRYRMASLIDLRALDNPAVPPPDTGHAATGRRSPHDESQSRRPRNSELVSRSQAAARGPSR